jgi:ferredoxin-like protein FixX
MKALDHGSTWHMKHACPACLYKLEGEDTLIFDMLTTIDGNNSLVVEDETGEPTLAKSSE